jgi:phosphatidylinositol alpha-1,6-mannosyltransferase
MFNGKLAAAPHKTVHLGIGAAVHEPITPPADPPVALMISRLLRSEDYKGHREVVSAWPLVLERMPTAELWIAGDGDLRKDLEKGVRSHGLADRVRFFGQVSEAEKQNLLARCRCLAMPSRAEGFGLVYLEAMRMGRPCLVSTLDAGREVVAPPLAGLAADPDDSGALAETLCRLLSPGREWDQWSTMARHRYEEQFTASHFQDRLLKALNAVIA